MADKSCAAKGNQGSTKCTAPYSAWYLKDSVTDREAENKTDPPEYLTDEEIYLETEAVMGHVDLGDTEDAKELEKRARTVRDMTVNIPVSADYQKDPKNYEKTTDKSWSHHFHVGDTLRVVTNGSGYADVQDLNGRWIRRPVARGDFYMIPGGCYHRVIPDENRSLYVLMMHYDKKDVESHGWPESQNEPPYVHYIERMKSLRRALPFKYRARPGSVDCNQAPNKS